MNKAFAIITILITLFLCACTPNIAPIQTPTPPASQQPGEVTPTPCLVADPTPEVVDPKQMYVTGSNVNVRSEANTTSSVLTALKRNTVVTAYQQKNGWYYIEYAENKFGYMSAQYLSDEKYIATAEEQLNMMSEFDLYKNMPEYLDLMLPERFFAVTDLNQNGRLEIVLVSENHLQRGTSTNVNIFEVDEDYAALKKYSEHTRNGALDFWPDITCQTATIYIKDNKYCYYFDPIGNEVGFICFDNYSPTSTLLADRYLFEIRNEDGTYSDEYEYRKYHNSNSEEITKEEYDAMAKDAFFGATKKTVSFQWELVETETPYEKPLYNYSKATSEQRLIALKKSYEGFVIK